MPYLHPPYSSSLLHIAVSASSPPLSFDQSNSAVSRRRYTEPALLPLSKALTVSHSRMNDETDILLDLHSYRMQ